MKTRSLPLFVSLLVSLLGLSLLPSLARAQDPKPDRESAEWKKAHTRDATVNGTVYQISTDTTASGEIVAWGKGPAAQRIETRGFSEAIADALLLDQVQVKELLTVSRDFLSINLSRGHPVEFTGYSKGQALEFRCSVPGKSLTKADTIEDCAIRRDGRELSAEERRSRDLPQANESRALSREIIVSETPILYPGVIGRVPAKRTDVGNGPRDRGPKGDAGKDGR